jgi:hypothetical protein
MAELVLLAQHFTRQRLHKSALEYGLANPAERCLIGCRPAQLFNKLVTGLI